MAGKRQAGPLGHSQNSQYIDQGTMCRSESPLPGSLGTASRPTPLLTQIARITHVVVAFEGWNAPWEDEGGQKIPLNKKNTVVAIVNGITKQYAYVKQQKLSMANHSLKVISYATDTDDDVKGLAENFIQKNVSRKASNEQTGKIIIYGYSWGGDTAIELTKDLKEKGYAVALLVTVDAALGPFNGPAVRDRNIPSNVKKNLNYYTTTPGSRVGSKGMPNRADDTSKTEVVNIPYTGPSHGNMDEHTQEIVIQEIVDALIDYQLYSD